jgi:glutathione S-transferase
MNKVGAVAVTAILAALYHIFPALPLVNHNGPPQLKLTYLDVPGRAELSRLILSAGNVSFEDERLTRDEFMAIKPTLPLGQVPVLEVNGTTYSQSMAIARYTAKLGGLYPQDPIESLRVDMVSEFLVDIKSRIPEIAYRTPDETQKAEKTKQLLEELVPKTMTLLEGFVQRPFFLGHEMTYADLQLFDLVKNALKKYPTFSLEKYPNLTMLVANVEKNANVAAYLAKKHE